MARTLEVKIVGDASQYQRTLKNAGVATDRFAVSLKSLAKVAGVAFGFHELVRGFEDVIGAASDAQASQAKLAVAFKNSGLAVSAYGKQIDALRESGRRLGFTNTQTNEAMSRLVTATGSVAKASKDLATAQNFARFKNIDLGAATQTLTSAMAGNVRAIKALGIAYVPTTTAVDALKRQHLDLTSVQGRALIAAAKLDDKNRNAAAVIELLTQKVHGQADAYSKTYQGAMARFRAALDDLEERIGNKLLPTMTRWANYLTDHLPQIEKFLQNVADKANTLWGVVKKLADVTGGWQTVLGTLLALKFASVITGWLVPLTGAGGMLPTLNKLNRTKWMVTIGISIIGGELLAQLQRKIDSLTGTVDTSASAPSSTGAGPMEKTQPAGTKLYRNSKTGDILAVGTGKAWVWNGKKWVGYAQFQAFDPDHPPAFLKPYFTGGVSAGGKAGSLRGYGGAGPVTTGSVEPTPTHTSTHETRNLPGYPAFDYMVKAGTAVKAPENGYIVGHSGSKPTGHPADVYGYSLYFYGVETHSMYFMTHLSDAAGDGYYPKGSIIGYVADQGRGSHVHVGVNRGSGKLATPDRAPSGTGRLVGTHGFKSAAAAALGGAVGIDPFAAVSSGGAVSGGKGRGATRKITPAPPIFGAIGNQIAADVTGATSHIATSLDKLMKMIIAKQAALKAALAKARADLISSFKGLSDNIMSAFDAINAQWQSPAAKRLAAMQAEDTMKSAQDAYAQAVKDFGADSPEAKDAARALQEAQLSADAAAEEEAHAKKVKADKDALEKRLNALYKEAGGAKTKAQAAKIQKQINALLAEYGITPETVQGALDWNAAQTLFVSSMGSLKESLDALTKALGGATPGGGGGGGGGNDGLGDRGTNPPASGGVGGGSFVDPDDPRKRIRRQHGGFLPGMGGIPILAHGGEYVIRKKVVDRLGVGFMNRLNRYDDGGVVHPWQLDDAYMDPGYRDKLMEAERQAKLKYGGSSIFNPRNWTPDIVNTATKYQSMLTQRYGDLIHFEDGWIPEIYNAVQKSSGIIESALASPPDNIWDRTHGKVWYDLGQGRGRKPAIPSRLGKGGYGTGSWGSGLTPAKLEDVVSGYVPSFALGGIMPHTGLAYVHRGETISPAGRAGTPVVNVYIGDEQIAARVESKIVERGRRGGALQARTPS